MRILLADLFSGPSSRGRHDGQVVTRSLVETEVIKEAVGEGKVLPQSEGAEKGAGSISGAVARAGAGTKL